MWHMHLHTCISLSRLQLCLAVLKIIIIAPTIFCCRNVAVAAVAVASAADAAAHDVAADHRSNAIVAAGHVKAIPF